MRIGDNVTRKQETIECAKKVLSETKKELQKMLTEQKIMHRCLKKGEEESTKEQQTLRIKIIKHEELLKQDNDKLKETEKEYEETKKGKLEIIQAGKAILQEIAQDRAAVQREKQTIEEYLERIHAENMNILSETLKPLEEVPANRKPFYRLERKLADKSSFSKIASAPYKDLSNRLSRSRICSSKI